MIKFLIGAVLLMSISCTSKKSEVNTDKVKEQGKEAVAQAQEKSTDVCEVDHKEKNIYKVCQDQKSIWGQAVGEAGKEKMVIGVFGANWCSWCHSLHEMLVKGDLLGQVSGKFQVVEIGVFNGKKRITSGNEILKSLLKVSSDEDLKKKVEGIPFLVVYNPRTGKLIEKNTATLEKNEGEKKGHDPELVKKFLEESYKKLKAKKG